MKFAGRTVMAFTLIEILIVISIILIIASMGIGAYSSARRGITVDLESDKIVATLHSFRSEAQNTSKCIGMIFQKGKTPRRIESGFLNMVDGCDTTSGSSPLPFDSDIAVSALTLGINQRGEFSVLFVPPLGIMQFVPSAGDGSIEISTKTSSSKRTIVLNSQTGKIEKK